MKRFDSFFQIPLLWKTHKNRKTAYAQIYLDTSRALLRTEGLPLFSLNRQQWNTSLHLSWSSPHRWPVTLCKMYITKNVVRSFMYSSKVSSRAVRQVGYWIFEKMLCTGCVRSDKTDCSLYACTPRTEQPSADPGGGDSKLYLLKARF